MCTKCALFFGLILFASRTYTINVKGALTGNKSKEEIILINYVMTIEEAKSLEDVVSTFVEKLEGLDVSFDSNGYKESIALVNRDKKITSPYLILPHVGEFSNSSDNVIMLYLLEEPIYITGKSLPIHFVINIITRCSEMYFSLLKELMFLMADEQNIKEILGIETDYLLELFIRSKIEEARDVPI